MARTERSAGVIVFRIDPESPTDRLYLLLDYGKYWDYPKGHLEPGEDDKTAALRELAEETGLTDVRLVPGFAREIAYYFKHPRHGLVRKEVVFFAGKTGTNQVVVSHEHVGFVFLPLDRAVERLTYVNAKDVLRRVDAFLGQVGPPM